MEVVEVTADFTGDAASNHEYHPADVNALIAQFGQAILDHINSLQQRINELEAR